ncbi:metal ABC transporter ATP-binding protein [Leptolyngbya sp. FACHB-261]|uniref:metal ABC transporter ATP-binding protein n=1 Tax=Leptolyngbya sp. FACHB-261 TaxID=2692806 RepID=UPI00168250CE|nr:metal ABC transporter ATP-binding protein [Leptolyngbya sp. FACHB-261]MBD2102697.1 metal ABC transporter ATP-binding protein [Leptolyngbya sp. FACHB-261]
METILEVEQLTVLRGRYAAVQDVSFRLEAGTDTAIIGPNGAGKSTLVQAILGILPWQSGEVSLLGQLMNRSGHFPTRVRKHLAYLPQSFLFDRGIPMTVSELVGLGWGQLGPSLPGLGHRQRQQAVQQALTQVNASHLLHQSISGLSGGETKRVLLACCLVCPRRLLVLDEAPAGLDSRGESEFYQLLNQLKTEHHWTILQVSHDLEMVSRHCDRVICLNRTLVCQGPPEVALSPENLMVAYGPEFTRYRHSH